MTKVAVLDDYQGVSTAMAGWEALGDRVEVTVFQDTITDRAALIERLRPFDIVCLMRERTPFKADLIEALPSLKLIVTTGKRNLSIDVAAAAARGIPVCGTSSSGYAAAELAFALIIGVARGIVAEGVSMRDGGWQVGLGRELHGATLGLIGLGRLGAMVAGYAKAFGMRMIAWSENLTSERCAEVGVEPAESLHALLAAADISSIHLVLSDRSRGLIDAAALAAMKPDGCLVNTSRGPIVDTAALLEALEDGRIEAAAIDVYDEEPLPADHALRRRTLIDSGKLLLTPHIGYVTRQNYAAMYSETCEDVAAWLDGAPIRVIAP